MLTELWTSVSCEEVCHIFCGNQHVSITVAENMEALCGERNCGLIQESERLVVIRSELLRKASRKSFNGHLISLRLLFFSEVTVSVLLLQVK